MSAALSLGLSLVAGCQEPFGTDRHELAGFRIAALTLSAGPDPLQVQPHAVTVVSGRLWTDDPVRLRWHWFETASTEAILNLTPDTPALGEGPAPTLQLPASGGVIALVASTAAGDIRRAWIDVPSDGPSTLPLTGVTLASLEWDVPTLTAEDLERSARLGLDTPATDWIAVAGAARLTATFEPPPTVNPRVRWMATAPYGTFFELERDSTDWVAGRVELDDGEITTREVLPAGPLTVLALALDDQGNNQFTAREIWIGPPEVGIWTSGDRWIATDVDPPEGPLVRAELALSDAAPTGLALTEVQAIQATDLPQDDPYGTEALLCSAPTSGPFDPSWMLDGRCLRSQVDGATVVLEIQ